MVVDKPRFMLVDGSFWEAANSCVTAGIALQMLHPHMLDEALITLISNIKDRILMRPREITRDELRVYSITFSDIKNIFNTVYSLRRSKIEFFAKEKFRRVYSGLNERGEELALAIQLSECKEEEIAKMDAWIEAVYPSIGSEKMKQDLLFEIYSFLIFQREKKHTPIDSKVFLQAHDALQEEMKTEDEVFLFKKTTEILSDPEIASQLGIDEVSFESLVKEFEALSVVKREERKVLSSADVASIDSLKEQMGEARRWYYFLIRELIVRGYVSIAKTIIQAMKQSYTTKDKSLLISYNVAKIWCCFFEKLRIPAWDFFLSPVYIGQKIESVQTFYYYAKFLQNVSDPITLEKYCTAFSIHQPCGKTYGIILSSLIDTLAKFDESKFAAISPIFTQTFFITLRDEKSVIERIPVFVECFLSLLSISEENIRTVASRLVDFRCKKYTVDEVLCTLLTVPYSDLESITRMKYPLRNTSSWFVRNFFALNHFSPHCIQVISEEHSQHYLRKTFDSADHLLHDYSMAEREGIRKMLFPLLLKAQWTVTPFDKKEEKELGSVVKII